METRQPSRWKSMLLWSGVAVLVWALEYVWQYYGMVNENSEVALVRSFGLTAATLVGAILFLSTLFKWIPRLAQHWRVRRYLGISAFVAAFLHVATVNKFYFDLDLTKIYYSFNPFENAYIFGSIGFWILILLAATSSDVLMRKLHPKNWKFLHRFVYLAFIVIIFHFLQMNPDLHEDPAGVLLYVITAAAVCGQLWWFVKTIARKWFRTPATYIGLGLLFLAVVIWYFLYQAQN